MDGSGWKVIARLRSPISACSRGQSYEVYHRTILTDPTFRQERIGDGCHEAARAASRQGGGWVPVMEAIGERHPEKREEILVVCHGMMMVALWAHLARGAGMVGRAAETGGVWVVSHEADGGGTSGWRKSA